MEMRKYVARIVAGEVKSRSRRGWLRMTESSLSRLSLVLNCGCTGRARAVFFKISSTCHRQTWNLQALGQAGVTDEQTYYVY